jgi:hypothetical protein
MDKPQKEFNLINLGILHQRIHALKARADEGKRITPKDINELVAIMEHVPAELQQRCNPVDPKDYGG